MVEVRAEYYPNDNHVYVNMDDSPYPDHINVESFTEPDVRRRVYVPEPPTCTMEPDGYYGEQHGIYKCSNCGELWQFVYDGPKENHWTCCPKCMAIIKEDEE